MSLKLKNQQVEYRGNLKHSRTVALAERCHEHPYLVVRMKGKLPKSDFPIGTVLIGKPDLRLLIARETKRTPSVRAPVDRLEHARKRPRWIEIAARGDTDTSRGPPTPAKPLERAKISTRISTPPPAVFKSVTRDSNSSKSGKLRSDFTVCEAPVKVALPGLLAPLKYVYAVLETLQSTPEEYYLLLGYHYKSRRKNTAVVVADRLLLRRKKKCKADVNKRRIRESDLPPNLTDMQQDQGSWAAPVDFGFGPDTIQEYEIKGELVQEEESYNIPGNPFLRQQ
ncbi:hypothetical protein B0H19DRAFT_1057028 [Mycena capillaripes]|nr:hypothetical protein B0H19DRAFT_1057028 [Mycena capillaripes]